jgi:hypothetical protein
LKIVPPALRHERVVEQLRRERAIARFRLYDLAGARDWLTTDTLVTLRVWSRWPHDVRAETIARTVGAASGG